MYIRIFPIKVHRGRGQKFPTFISCRYLVELGARRLGLPVADLCMSIFSGEPKIRSRPSKPNQRKGQNEKFMNFALFCEFWCFSLGKQARFTLNFCSGMPLRKVHELTFLWFGLPGPLLKQKKQLVCICMCHNCIACTGIIYTCHPTPCMLQENRWLCIRSDNNFQSGINMTRVSKMSPLIFVVFARFLTLTATREHTTFWTLQVNVAAMLQVPV